jgi:hypothetical protein
MKKLINLCCFINIDLTDPNIKKLTEKLFCNERIGEYIARDYLVLLDLTSTNIKYQLHSIFILKTIQNKFCREDNFFHILFEMFSM